MTVYIVVLNWNGWKETVQCLESVFRMDHQDFVAVVCDNASQDNSLQQIIGWADGVVTTAPPSYLGHTHVLAKPVPYDRLTRSAAEAGRPTASRLVIIENQANLGFAGGCNVGVRFAMTRPGMEYVWLLNNDTVVAPDCLAQLLQFALGDPRIGLAGSQVRYYDRPSVIQTQGGILNRWLCTTHSLYAGATAGAAHPDDGVASDYIPGMSMLASRAFISQVGVMEERYFLYYEEIDWAERGKRDFHYAICPQSIVYHHGGASIGSHTEGGERGKRSEYYLLRNRLLFAQRFYKPRLIIVYVGFLASIGRRLLHGRWSRAYIAICALVGFNPN